MRVVVRKDGTVKMVLDPKNVKLPVKFEGKENIEVMVERARKHNDKVLVSWYQLQPGIGVVPYEDAVPEALKRKVKEKGKVANFTFEPLDRILDFLMSL